MLGEDVKAIRQEMGLSQAQFAEQFHINLYTLRQWERKNHELGSVATAFMQCIKVAPNDILAYLNTEE